MTYSLSADLFKEMDYDILYNILYTFLNSILSNKIAVDNKRAILQRYKDNTPAPFQSELVSWERRISDIGGKIFTFIDIDLAPIPNEEYCLTIASSINGEKALIVNSKQNLVYNVDETGHLEYQGNKIHVYERTDAMKKLVSSGSRVTKKYYTKITVENSPFAKVTNNSNNTNNG